ncbi:hypothetical protein [Bacillus sp. B15-48]|uniref:hypothetical protein n=1 Tax=Bacillus sp. B15-48 TaxID=1548601 RepID=UPI00193FB496|nr:hypothetical protein [Bacillus sp. B15-48]MBM4762055.1 hypothetical protein [Bacillus sp. B15-48]
MYRFSIASNDWVLRFTANLELDDDERETIIQSMMYIGPKLGGFSHGDSFIIFDENMGVIVFLVEKIPAFILTVLTVVSEDAWFVKRNSTIDPYPNKGNK